MELNLVLTSLKVYGTIIQSKGSNGGLRGPRSVNHRLFTVETQPREG